MNIQGVEFKKQRAGRNIEITANYRGNRIKTVCNPGIVDKIVLLLAAEALRMSACPYCGKESN